ncbi:DHA2 family efflux MFS transporter permease subunit [Streptomyces sp. A7024]|uniref:DHA2 family efflux MFS transporter permease subunit n=1 Tax=Streptomyces coryli TaxID=1128680 RepID=A0A6G4UB94_9ACTN|nr:DHA2 family efflux MFS transporter permease subunit [Streptomyces coryli]NGN69413.1 DHA2 family efflux MFS transporter permease subunit [Streptomyces coryli]
MILLLSAAATFMAFLDTTVVNVAFPALAADFPGASVPDLTWVVTSYGVLLAALLTPAGRFADLIGRREVFLASLALFTIASLACALAPNVPFLIAVRAVQGIGAAGMIPAGLGLVLAETPPEKRAAAIGLWGAAGSLAAAAGPSLGGLLVSEIDWRAVFWLNVPIGLAVLAAGARRLPHRPATGRKLPDLPGTACVTVGIGAVVVGLTKGEDWGWMSGATWGCIAGGGALIGVALLRSRRHEAPVIETQLWHTRMFAMANLTSFCIGAALFVWFLSGPLYLTTIWHYSILEAGLAVTPGAVASAVAAVVVGRRVPPQKQRPIVVVGLIIFFALNVWVFNVLGSEPDFLAVWLPYGTIGGAVLGAALTSVTTAASISVHPLKFASGTGMNTTARQFGGALGIAAMAAVFAAGNLALPQAYLDAFLLAGVFALAGALPALLLFDRKGMAAVAETQRQVQEQMAAMAASQRPSRAEEAGR